MSTFSGQFDEFPFISADRFDGDNLQSKVFFLSHCHADHMMGLKESNGLPGPIYTSAVSKVLLEKQFPHVTNIRILEVDCPEEVNYQANDEQFSLAVTALPARHCPGSIMLLIQSANHCVLYTGDFRLAKKDFDNCIPLLKSIDLDTVYMDSTFLNEAYIDFPSQIESIQTICRLITEWLSKTPQGLIYLQTPAQYGSEFVFMEIARKLHLKIYVNNEQYEKYICFPDMDQCISNRLEECKIVYSSSKRYGWVNSPATIYRTIQISALYWRYWTPKRPIYEETKPNFFRVAYSSHSSRSELEDFLKYINPATVKFNVVPGEKDAAYMRKYVDAIFKKAIEEASHDERQEIQTIVNYKFDNIFFVKEQRTGNERQLPLKVPIKRVKYG